MLSKEIVAEIVANVRRTELYVARSTQLPGLPAPEEHMGSRFEVGVEEEGGREMRMAFINA
jgi:hypothetical protein